MSSQKFIFQHLEFSLVRSPCNAFLPGAFSAQEGSAISCMEFIMYYLFYSFFSFLLSLFFSSLQTQSFQHSFQPLLPLGMNISNSIQTAYGQCPGGEYVNIDAVPKRSWVGNMMKTATYYSVLVQSLSVAVRYRRR